MLFYLLFWGGELLGFVPRWPSSSFSDLKRKEGPAVEPFQ